MKKCDRDKCDREVPEGIRFCCSACSCNFGIVVIHSPECVG